MRLVTLHWIVGRWRGFTPAVAVASRGP